jgi:hypothetical protein
MIVLFSLLIIAALIVAAVGVWWETRSRSSSSGSPNCKGTPTWLSVDCLDFDVDGTLLAASTLATVPMDENDDASTSQPGVISSVLQNNAVIPCSTTVPEAEEDIAANPADSNGLQWIASVSDFSLRSGYNTTKYCYTLDGGNTWTQNFVPLDTGTLKPTSADFIVWDVNSDPGVAFSPSGNTAYVSSLYFNTTDSANGIYVAANTLPTSSGESVYSASQVYRVVANTSPSTTNFEDKPWLTVDPTTGDLYLSWTHFTVSTNYIVFSKSTDSGQTWSTFVQVSPTAMNGSVQGSSIAADGRGNVWIVWTSFYTNNIARIWGVVSTNHGATWTTSPIAVSPYFLGQIFPSQYRKNPFAAMAIDAATQTVHVVYPATANNGTSKIQYVRAPNNTTVFSTPVTLVNTAAGNQFFPSIGVDAKNSGYMQIAWFDTRNSSVTNNQMVDVYTVRSKNNGKSFGTNKRVTPTSTNVGTNTFIGDYCGVDIQAKRALPAFAFLVTPLSTRIIITS